MKISYLIDFDSVSDRLKQKIELRRRAYILIANMDFNSDITVKLDNAGVKIFPYKNRYGDYKVKENVRYSSFIHGLGREDFFFEDNEKILRFSFCPYLDE